MRESVLTAIQIVNRRIHSPLHQHHHLFMIGADLKEDPRVKSITDRLRTIAIKAAKDSGVNTTVVTVISNGKFSVSKFEGNKDFVESKTFYEVFSKKTPTVVMGDTYIGWFIQDPMMLKDNKTLTDLSESTNINLLDILATFPTNGDPHEEALLTPQIDVHETAPPIVSTTSVTDREAISKSDSGGGAMLGALLGGGLLIGIVASKKK